MSETWKMLVWVSTGHVFIDEPSIGYIHTLSDKACQVFMMNFHEKNNPKKWILFYFIYEYMIVLNCWKVYLLLITYFWMKFLNPCIADGENIFTATWASPM